MFDKHLEELDDDLDFDEVVDENNNSNNDNDSKSNSDDDENIKKTKKKKSIFSTIFKKKQEYLTESDIQTKRKKIINKTIVMGTVLGFVVIILIAILITVKRTVNTKRVIVKLPKEQQSIQLIDSNNNLWKLQVDNQIHGLDKKIATKIQNIRSLIRQENNNTIQAVTDIINNKVTKKISSIQTEVNNLKGMKQGILNKVQNENQEILQKAKTYTLEKSIELNNKLSNLKPVSISIQKNKNNSNNSGVNIKHYQNQENVNKVSKAEQLKKAHLKYEKKVKIVEKEVANLNIESIPVDTTVQNALNANQKSQSSEKYNYHLMTGFTKAILITGVSAPTFSSGLLNPKPVLLSVTSRAIIANDEGENIKNCMLIGKATGNMNTSRAEILITRISCSIPTDKPGIYKKIEATGNPIGWVIGEDGKYGLRGRLVDSAGKVIMRQIMVGFLQGVSQAFAPSSILPVQSTNSNPIKNVNKALASGVATGASNAFSSLAQYYKKMLDGMYPYIDVMAGRKVTVLLKGFQDIKITKYKKVDVSAEDKREGDGEYEIKINYDNF